MIALIKLLATILFISHIFACIWIIAVDIEKSYLPDSTWLDEVMDDQNDQIKVYIHAYYFATVTMVTVGYGYSLPTTKYEMLLCIVTMLIACGVFAYSVNCIGIIL